MKFKITDIQNQDNTQLNVLVDVFRDNGNLLTKRVFTLPDEKYSKMNNVELAEWVTNEVLVYKRALAKEKDYKELINIEYEV